MTVITGYLKELAKSFSLDFDYLYHYICQLIKIDKI